MKLTTFVSSLLMVAGMPALAIAQTGPGPAPPIIGSGSVKAKGSSAIPPAPAVSARSSSKSKATKRAAARMAEKNRVPGFEVTGRIDMSGKPVAFYPTSKGAIAVDPRKQQSAIKTNTKRVAKQEQNPRPTQPPH